VLDVASYNIDGFLLSDACVTLTLLNNPLRNKQSQWKKKRSSRKFSFQKLTQFSKVNNVPDGPASYTHGFHLIDTCISQYQLNRDTWIKESLSSPWKQKLHEEFHSESDSIITREHCVDAPASNADGFLWRGTLFHQCWSLALLGTKSAYLNLG
jgi:hypothetical protein